MSPSRTGPRLTLLTHQEAGLPPGFSSDFLSELITALETDRDEKLYHSFRVSIISHFLGVEVGLERSELNKLFFASLLHDIGGVSSKHHIATMLVASPDVFTQKTDFSLFAHPMRSFSLLNRFPTFREIGEIVRSHHEFYDGTGYPRGLKGEEIPLLSRILRIADSVDIILRIHSIESPEELNSYLHIGKGEEFDPALYTIFMEKIGKSGLLPKLENRNSILAMHKEIRQGIKDGYYLGTTDTVTRFFAAVANLIDNVTSSCSFHSTRVAELGEQIGLALGMGEEDLLNIRWASFLHDLGKVVGDRSIYLKKQKLSEEEWGTVRSHPQRSYDILNSVSGLQKVAYFVLYHHENFDGSGYPSGLSGTRIPLISRILRIADAFEAMTSNRLYQRKRDWQIALKELKRQAGIQFDPAIVEKTVELLKLS